MCPRGLHLWLIYPPVPELRQTLPIGRDAHFLFQKLLCA